MTQGKLDFDPKVAYPFPFRGASYVPGLDGARLETQLDRICWFMTHPPGVFMTVAEIKRAMERQYPENHWPENSIQAQLRNAKKAGYRHERRRVGGPERARVGLFEFALWPPDPV